VNILSNCLKWQSPPWKLASLSFGLLGFLSTNISQGSVSTHLRCSGVFNFRFSRNLQLSLLVKKIENLLTFGKVRAKNRVVPFSGQGVYIT